jgi:hypothetical protein
MRHGNKESIYFIIFAALLTSVILVTLTPASSKVLLMGLGYYLLPYLIMYLAFRNTKKDMYWSCDLGALVFSIVGGLSLLIFSIISPDPFGLLFIPAIQLVTFVVLHGAIIVLRIFAKDMRYAEKVRKDDL